MSDLIFVISQGDTQPTLRRQLQDGDGNPINLTGATVRFYMQSKDGTQLVNAGSCTITDVANGWIEYDWQSGDTDTAGFHRAEFEVEYSPGNFESFPNEGYLQIKIRGDLKP